MPLSHSADLAQKLLLITLELAQTSPDAETLRGLVQARAEVLDKLEKLNLDPKARHILARVQDAETEALLTLQDWRGEITSEVTLSRQHRVAAETYARAA
ncbi:MAG: hypothetical protein KF784_03880 [Fimbriimonadaceae bacterium]|nr:hypothetical protein [Fimbriimonadaceae bacterium]